MQIFREYTIVIILKIFKLSNHNNPSHQTLLKFNNQNQPIHSIIQIFLASYCINTSIDYCTFFPIHLS